MNGAILDVPRAEMEKRFEEIVAFADIGAFIDQPVKTYSSGMFVRLAFAVTISVDADVLLIDEALAVGDVFFRQKCYQRLETLRERGVAIVFVSHATTEVEQFCQRGLLLHHGDVLFQGPAPEAVKRYYLIDQQGRLPILTAPQGEPPLRHSESASVRVDDAFWPAPTTFLDISNVAQISNGWARCTNIAICNSDGQACGVFEQGETASFFYEFELLHSIEVPSGGLEFQNEKGILVHGKNTLEYGTDVPATVISGSRLRFRQDIDLEIAVGEYTFTIGLATISRHDYEHRSSYSYESLAAKLVRLCHLPIVGQFAVVLRRHGKPVQLLHHGVANLHGRCRLTLQTPAASDVTTTSAST
jgi:lipopolysaccharide transport system ATP-binding protein